MWESPVFIHQNGFIRYYHLIIKDQQFNTSDISVNITGSTSYTQSNLEEYNTYRYEVTAATDIGLGPYSDQLVFTTAQDGK